MKGSRIEGMEEALENLNAAVAKVEKKSQAGFWEAGLKIMRAAQQELVASVVTGNLRASGYVRSVTDFIRPDSEKLKPRKNVKVPAAKLKKVGVELGFTANYALYAHENMEGRAPKFLERVIIRNKTMIAQIVKRRSGGK